MGRKSGLALFAIGFCALSGIVRADVLTHTTASLSEARSSPAATAVGSKIMIAGGSNHTGGGSDVVDIYDTQTGQWSTANLSRGNFSLAATTVGSLAIFGGRGHVDIYDDSTGLWSTESLSDSRYGLVATSVGTKALFAGGRYGGYSDVVDIYDTASGLWSTAKLSVAREGLAAVTVGNKALFAGGSTGPTQASTVVDIYDLDTGEWSTASLSKGRSSIAVATVGSKAIFAGGSGLTNVVDIYDADTDTWSTAKLSQSRLRAAGATLDHLAIIAGGRYGRDVVEIYDADTGLWSTQLGFTPREGLAAASAGNVAIFAGGLIQDTSILSSAVDIFTIPNPTVLSACLDLKPGSGLNPLNVKSKGVVPAILCAADDFDVADIDPSTIRLTGDGINGGVPPLQWSLETVGEPGPGGTNELMLKFDTQRLVNFFGLEYYQGEDFPVLLTGRLFDGTAFEGRDYLKILMTGGANGNGGVGTQDYAGSFDDYGAIGSGIPEPATLALLTLGGIVIIRKRRCPPSVA